MASLSASVLLTQSQRLAVTPALKQALNLLQMPGLEAAAAVEEMLAKNPLVERTDDAGTQESAADTPETGTDFEVSNLMPVHARTDENDTDPLGNLAAEVTLTEELTREVGCLNLTDTERECALWLIGNLDENGFLSDPLTELTANAPFSAEPEVWATALKRLQSLEPAGVGARNCTEALILQTDRALFEAEDPEERATLTLARRILSHTALFLGKLTPDAAAKKLAVTPETFHAAVRAIAGMNPRPAAGFSGGTAAAAVVPDVIAVKTVAGWRVRINDALLPALTFNHALFEMLTAAKLEGKDKTAWRDRAHEARAFIHAVEERTSTIVSVAQCIVDRQPGFFEAGKAALKPMVLRDVAEHLGIAESTVSRAVSGKYLLTPRGTLELKAFFTSAVTGESGESVSSARVRHRIRELIDAEDPAKPLSDDTLSQLLAHEGIVAARRTVAKYREAEGIGAKSVRRRMKALAGQ